MSIFANGCYCEYEYNEFRAPIGEISLFESENELEQATVTSIGVPRQKDYTYVPLVGFSPFSIILLEKVQLDVNPNLTKNFLLTAIKDLPYTVKVANKYGFTHDFLKDKDKDKDMVLVNIGDAGRWSADFLFCRDKLTRWTLFASSQSYGRYLQIGKYKGNKFYPMPITVHQMKEIFGEPKSVNTRLNLK